MAQYNLDSLIGKSITSSKPVKVYRTASDTAKPYRTIAAGQSVGILYSWLNPKEGRKKLWLMFYDSDKKPYYLPSGPGEGLKAPAGSKTAKQEAKEKDAQNKPWYERILKPVGLGLLGLGTLYILANSSKSK